MRLSLFIFFYVFILFYSFSCFLIYSSTAFLSLFIYPHCVLYWVPSPPAKGAAPHLPIYLVLFPSRKQDTQMAKRPPLCKGIHSEMRFREQKVQRSPLLWAEWDTCHRTVLYGLMVLPVPLHSNKAETQGKCIISSLGGKNFWSEHAIGLPMIEEVRFSDTGSPF